MGALHQLGVKAEVTPGTAVTVDRFYEFLSEDLTFNQEWVASAGIRADRRVLKVRRPGRKGVEGNIQMELVNKGLGLLFKQALGDVTTTTPGGGTISRDHKAKVGSLIGDSLTIQVGREDYAGTAHPFTYNGCKITSWEISCENDGIPTVSFGIDGWNETTATSLATASYATGISPYVFTEGVLLVGGADVGIVKSATVTGENGLLTDRFDLGSGVKAQQLESGEFRAYGGSLTAEFNGLAAYNAFKNQTQAALLLTFTSTTMIEGAIPYKVVVSLPAIEYDGSTPTASGPELPDLELPFTVLDTGQADGPVQITVTDDSATP